MAKSTGWDPIIALQTLHYLTLSFLIPPMLVMFAESGSLEYEGGAANVGMIMDWREMAGRPTTRALPGEGPWKSFNSVWSGGKQVGMGSIQQGPLRSVDPVRSWIIAVCWMAASAADTAGTVVFAEQLCVKREMNEGRPCGRLSTRCRGQCGDGESASGRLGCGFALGLLIRTASSTLVKLTADESANIALALRTLGLSFSARLDAAAAVAVFERNPVPADKTASAYVNGASTQHRAHGPSPALCRPQAACRLVPPLQYCIDYAPLSALEGRARLLAAMRQRQAHYAGGSRTRLTHMPTGARARELSTQAQTYVLGVTNVGRVDSNYVAPVSVWPRPRDAPESFVAVNTPGPEAGAGKGLLRVDEMQLAVRMGSDLGALPDSVRWFMRGRYRGGCRSSCR
ncbi:hypothetical protein GSI_07456 [Ganoderma sinense ZZ0214-1]|uniref:Uncharacterized protein n=1 Tax=Ganoderma sinense ZZ0214-1 TaxID=1077348 RepID=A0A2G8S932_9APHY|nr:hypothetical protein GSI_07456 [Ganoderma sinense ZZ0214-1]